MHVLLVGGPYYLHRRVAAAANVSAESQVGRVGGLRSVPVLRSDPLHFGIEPVLVVGRVLHYPGGPVRFDQAVRAPDCSAAVAHFVLALHVPGQRVCHRVREVIRRAD